jgi:small subunit ribosomal protein S21
MVIVIKAKPGESTNQVIRKFKKKVQKDQILTTIREKQFYKKPSVVKKERLKEAKKRNRRNRRRG